MDIGLIILIVLLIAGGGFYFYKRKKTPKAVEQKEVPGFADFNMKVANLEMQGKVQNRDFVVAVIGIDEFKSKTPEQINDWIKSKIGREGTLSKYNAELGLQELTYTSDGKVYDVFFLLVEDTGQNVIDWKGPKPTPSLPKKIWTIDYDVDSTEDQTDYIMEQINSFPDGFSTNNTFEFPKTGKVWTEGGNADFSRKIKRGVITLLNRKNIDIQAEGVELFTKAPAVPFGGSASKYGTYSYRRHLCIWNSENINVHGLKISGSNKIGGKHLGTELDSVKWWKGSPDSQSPTGYTGYTDEVEAEHGIEILGSDKVLLENCFVYNVWGDGIYLGAYDQWEIDRMSNGVTILNPKIVGVGRQGIGAANSVRNVLVDNYTGELIRRSGIDLEPHTKEGVIYGFTVRSSNIECHLTPIAAGGRGRVDNILIENNKFSGSGNSLFCRTSNPEDMIIRKNWIFRGNERIGRRGGDAIKLGWVDNVTIENNKDSYSGKNYVSALFCRNLKVVGNEVNGIENVRAAGLENLQTDFSAFDNSAAIPESEMINYQIMKLKNPIE